MRVALVHDWLTGNRGGEKVLLELARLFPKATLFTLFHFSGSVPEEIEGLEIRTTFLQRLLGSRRFREGRLDYRNLLPLFPVAAETWDLRAFDLVISSSHCVAKNAKRGTAAFHVCYCHTPVRYLHDQFDSYFESRRALVRLGALFARSPLRAWDVRTLPRVDAFLANSENVRERILRLYGREAHVVPPPVDTSFFTPPPRGQERRGFLIVSALVPYKRIADALTAAQRSGFELTIVGVGPEEARLRRLAGTSATFAGMASPEALRERYRCAEAVLMPGEEDFGIVPLEAQACGAPVIALGLGGARETVRDGITGVLYGEPGPESLLVALNRFRALRFEEEALIANASRFSQAAFRERFRDGLAVALSRADRADLLETLRLASPAGPSPGAGPRPA